MEYQKLHKTIKGYPEAQEYTGDLLTEKCDILIPAAMEKAITVENANNIQAKIISEGANGPTTPGAHEILLKKNILVIPDMYANAGGVTGSYFEYLKNLNHISFGKLTFKISKLQAYEILNSVQEGLTKSGVCNVNIKPTPKLRKMLEEASEADIVHSGLEQIMEFAGHGIMKAAHDYELCMDIRTAAFVFAVEKIFLSYETAGLVM